MSQEQGETPAGRSPAIRPAVPAGWSLLLSQGIRSPSCTPRRNDGRHTGSHPMDTTLLDIPPGPLAALNWAITAIADNTASHRYADFLDGRSKSLFVLWCGDDDFTEFNSYRGDGDVTLSCPGQKLWCIPPGNYDELGRWRLTDMPSSWAYRVAVPLWLLKAPAGGVETLMAMGAFERDKATQTLGVGHYHPRWSAFTLDVYHPKTGLFQCRRFGHDPRECLDDIEVEALTQEIVDAGALPGPPEEYAPHWTPGVCGARYRRLMASEGSH